MTDAVHDHDAPVPAHDPPADDPAARGRAALAALAPETVRALAEVERVVARTVDAATLALVRQRVHDMLGLPVTPQHEGALPIGKSEALDAWESSDAFTERERALLAFVDQFVFAVSDMADAEVEALLAHTGPLHLHELANVVWAVDLTARADHVAAAVLA
ncbi:hypothetical protein ACOACO_06515 [Nocardioides sp. CPCC 205120]|uniref:hypothetical protein n=1 Tax=Nocardioides sp. CPCC 205120 TaxID=3406462 RepID=UPI003B507EB9